MKRYGIAMMVLMCAAVGHAYTQDAPYRVENTTKKLTFGTFFIRPGVNTPVDTQPRTTSTGYAWTDFSNVPYSVTYQAVIVPPPHGGPIEGSVSCGATITPVNGRWPSGTTLNVRISKVQNGKVTNYQCVLAVGQ